MLRVTLSDNSVPDLGFSSDPLLSTLRFQSVNHARHCCSARTWQSDLNLGGKTCKNHWNWYHIIHIIITYHSTYFNMKWYHFNGHCHHKTWRYRTPAMAPIICDGSSSFSAGAMPQQQLIETRHHIFQTDGLGQRMHDKYDKCIWKKKTLEKPVTTWQKVDYKML